MQRQISEIRQIAEVRHRVEEFTLPYLKEALRKLHKRTTYNKPVLKQMLLDALYTEPLPAIRVINEVYDSYVSYKRPAENATVRGQPTHNMYGVHARPHMNVPFTPDVWEVPSVGTTASKYAQDSDTVQMLEYETRQGLVENCRVLGLIPIHHRHPIANVMRTGSLTPAELEGLKKAEYKCIIRFLLYNPSSDTWSFSPIWPKDCKLTFENEIIFDRLPRNALGMQSVGQKEPTPAIDITDRVVRYGHQGGFTVSFSVALKASAIQWVVAVEVFRKKTEAEILGSIFPRTLPSQCIQRVKNFFGEDGESFGVSDVEITLKDPASYMPIKFAARGRNCDHLQCFDLFTFLTMHENSRSPNWNCPLCGKKTLVSDIVTDSWLQDIIDTRPDNCFSVRVKPNGSWEAIPEEPETSDADSDDEERNDDNEEEHMKRLKVSPMPFVSTPAPSPPAPKIGSSRADAIEILDDDDVLF